MTAHNGATVSHWNGTVDMSLPMPRQISLQPSNWQKILSPWLWN
jgi:hypothetical protein